MNWGQLDKPDWWWHYALDGVAGAVFGGLVTAFAVWLTLRHERRLSESTSARDAAVRVQSLAWRVGKSVQANAEDVAAWSPLMHQLHENLLIFQALTQGRWPKAYEEASAEMDELSRLLHQDPRTPHLDAIISAAAGVGGSVSSWITSPDDYR